MLRLGLNDLRRLSFPDFNILDIQFSPSERSLVIYIDGAWIEGDKNHEKLLGSGKLLFMDWRDFQVHSYNNELDKWFLISFENFENLKDICEVELVGGIIYLRGFGLLTGRWIEYKIDSSLVQLEFNEMPNC